MRILSPDGLYPRCAHEGCQKLAEDGYCDAGCCVGYQVRRAYCSEHSHRPTRVLEILGYSVEQQAFSRVQVRRVIMAMWGGAGLVFESAGKLEMERDLEQERARRAALTQQQDVANGPPDPRGAA